MSGDGKSANENRKVATENVETTGSSKHHDFFPEGAVSYTLAEAIKENRLGGELKDFGRRVFWVSLSYLMGGVAQWNGEYVKITGIDQGEDPNKFPNGLADLNFGEELIEGGTFAAGGAIGMLYLAKFLRNKEGKTLTKMDEAIAIVTGSFVGTAALSALGGFFHELVGRPDFPTMEIIQKLLGN